jgi:hypothetical protein
MLTTRGAMSRFTAMAWKDSRAMSLDNRGLRERLAYGFIGGLRLILGENRQGHP